MSLSTNLSPSFIASSVSPYHCVTNSRQLQSRERSSRRNHAAAESQLARAARRLRAKSAKKVPAKPIPALTVVLPSPFPTFFTIWTLQPWVSLIKIIRLGALSRRIFRFDSSKMPGSDSINKVVLCQPLTDNTVVKPGLPLRWVRAKSKIQRSIHYERSNNRLRKAQFLAACLFTKQSEWYTIR